MTMTRTSPVSTPDGAMRLFEAVPNGPAKGGIVVVQEAFGITGYISDVGRRLAEAGWQVVAPHLFHRSGDPVLSYADVSAVGPHMAALTPDGLLDDLDACLAYLADAGLPIGRTAVVGFCMGGTVAFLAAARRPIAAAVSFYGGGVLDGRFGLAPLVEMAQQLQAPWLGLYGDEDRGIPVEEVEALRSATAAAGVATEVVRYPGAGHGFHCDARPAYHESSAEDAWRRTLAWLDEHIPAQ